MDGKTPPSIILDEAFGLPEVSVPLKVKLKKDKIIGIFVDPEFFFKRNAQNTEITENEIDETVLKNACEKYDEVYIRTDINAPYTLVTSYTNCYSWVHSEWDTIKDQPINSREIMQYLSNQYTLPIATKHNKVVYKIWFKNDHDAAGIPPALEPGVEELLLKFKVDAIW